MEAGATSRRFAGRPCGCHGPCRMVLGWLESLRISLGCGVPVRARSYGIYGTSLGTCGSRPSRNAPCEMRLTRSDTAVVERFDSYPGSVSRCDGKRPGPFHQRPGLLGHKPIRQPRTACPRPLPQTLSHRRQRSDGTADRWPCRTRARQRPRCPARPKPAEQRRHCGAGCTSNRGARPRRLTYPAPWTARVCVRSHRRRLPRPQAANGRSDPRPVTGRGTAAKPLGAPVWMPAGGSASSAFICPVGRDARPDHRPAVPPPQPSRPKATVSEVSGKDDSLPAPPVGQPDPAVPQPTQRHVQHEGEQRGPPPRHEQPWQPCQQGTNGG